MNIARAFDYWFSTKTRDKSTVLYQSTNKSVFLSTEL